MAARVPAVRRRNLGYSLARAAHEGAKDKSKNLEDRLQLLARQDAGRPAPAPAPADPAAARQTRSGSTGPS